ncbi:TIGR02300 family protein [Fodinicurvata sp. EGI_FJ10296]|uniref:TIGR02300 family protein n=1 Tax=Fodinicurvata sp. EGI_FJ10296 TaxID=3231908 RepID=UPI00345220FF
MAKPEWGAKRICYSCGARYYDMRREPPVCPKCGTQFDPEAFLKSRRGRTAAVDTAAAKPAAAKARPAVEDDLATDAEEPEVEAEIETPDAEDAEPAEADDLAADDDVDSVIEDADDLDDSGLDDVAPDDDDEDDR